MKIITHKEDTIAAQATPPGRSAIAVVRISGKKCFDVIGKIFRKKGGNLNFESINYPSVHIGEIIKSNISLDEVVLTLYRAPKSYTGEDMAEISCHGSPYIVQQLMELIFSHGVRPAEQGEFTFRAFMNGKMDLTKAESVADLIESESGPAHDAAMLHYRGDYKIMIEAFRSTLVKFLSLLELELDFAEEDVEFARRDELLSLLTEVENKISRLTESFTWGNALKKGIPVAILGKPNAGKSTLMNLLAGDEKSIVSDIPGTTRDVVEDVVYLNGIPFRFIDTAGLRESSDVIEKIGIEKALDALKKSLILIYLFDVTQLGSGDLTQEKNYLIKTLGYQGKAFWVGNKSDLISMKELEDEFQGQEVLFISAKNNSGVEELKNRMVGVVNEGILSFKNQMVTNARHANSLRKCLDIASAVKKGLMEGTSPEFIVSDLKEMIRELDLITGKIVDEDILNYIFSNFCIGK
ncbi:MAG: tRNA uridine-5-carboxymethylaminomethyl(34) synthesis GTPase MnmE [Bacteroidia bacterium]|nr:tRNA uridine-5-carboxymethylaminomethyl(34) synthesis GTPase MnmE [Bacteroidia bacterium]